MDLMSSQNRAGTLTLKSTMPMEYSRGVLTNKWYLKRESEPKDFNLWSGEKPNLHQASYKILGKTLPDDVILTETETRSRQDEALKLLAESKNHDTTKQMIDMENKARLEERLDSYGNLSKTLPTHKKGHDERHFETTYVKDYEHPYPELLNRKSEKNNKSEFNKLVDNSFAYRKMVSQFSDIDAPKRTGINTFHVQHGEYPNQHLKNQTFSNTQNNLFG